MLAAPLAVGSVHSAAVVGLLGGALLALALQHRVLAAAGVEGKRASIPSLTFAFFAGLCLLQITPLPLGLVDLLNPARAAHLHDAWHLVFPAQELSQTGLWAPLSMDPAESADRGLRWLTLLVVAILAANHARLPKAWRDTLRLGALVGLIVLLVSAVQTFAGAEKILFIYLPRAGIKPFSTFVNPNQAAVFYGFSALSAFALALRQFQRHFAEALAASVLGLLLMVVMAEQNSDGANIGFIVAFIALGAFFLQGKQSERFLPREKARKLAAALLALPIIAPITAYLLLKVGPPRVSSWVGETMLGIWAQEKGNARLDMMAAALEAAQDYPLLGAGAGATRRVLAPYIDWSKIRPATIPTIENDTVQWVFEFGWAPAVLGMICLMSYLYFAARGHLRGRKTRYGVGMAAWLFLAFNTQFHFPFFALGASIGAIFLLENSIARTSPGAKSELKRGSLCLKSQRAQGAFFIGTLLLGGVFIAAINAYQPGWEEAAEPIDSASNTTPDTMFEVENVERYLMLTPSDGELFARLTQRALNEGELDQAAALAARAATLKPTAPMRLFAAQVYQRAGMPERALREVQQVYSPAYKQLHSRWFEAMVYPTLRVPEALAEGLTDADDATWRRAGRLIRERQGELAEVEFAQKLIELRPEHHAPYQMVVDNYLRAKKFELAEAWARLLIGRNLEGPVGDKPTGWALLARARRGQEGAEAARAVLIEAIEEKGVDQTLGEYLVDLRSSDPAEPERGEAAGLAAFRRAFCAHPDTKSLKRYCWLAEGWLDEHEERFEDADYAYQRLYSRMKQPQHYADFLARRGRCVDLNQFIVTVEEERAASAGAVKHIKRATARCAQNARESRSKRSR